MCGRDIENYRKTKSQWLEMRLGDGMVPKDTRAETDHSITEHAKAISLEDMP